MAQQGPKIQSVVVNQFLGLNTLDDPRSLNPSYSPYMLNVDITSTGSLQTRYGYETFATIPASTGGLSGIQPYYRTYDDNSAIDQSADTGHAYANTYTPPVAIAETATDKLTFTPTKTVVWTIGVYVVAKGTGDWTITLHDASNTVLGSATFPNAVLTNGVFNYFSINYTVTSGPLHFHVTSTVADGTLKANVAADLSTASYIETYSTIGDYLLIFHKGTAYFVTNSNTTPTSIGTYGTAGTDTGKVNGITQNNYVVYNDGYTGHTGKTWNGYNQASLNSGTIYPKYFGTYNNRLWTVGSTTPSTAQYSDASSVDTNLTAATNFISFGIGDGTDITAFIPALDKMNVLKENTIHAANFGFNADFNIQEPQELPTQYSSAGGAYAPGSAVPVYNYLYFLSKFGFQVYGNLEQGVQANQPLPLSFTIDNTTKNINYLYKNEISGTFFAGKYMCATPYSASTTNNYVFVLNEVVKRRYGVDNWGLYTGIPAKQYAIFRDSNKRDQLYFASTVEPAVYKFNTTYSDNGFGYDRIWRSKSFQFGERTRWFFVDIEGYKPINATLYVDTNCDGAEANNFEITDTNLITSASGGGYIGEVSVGAEYEGGGYYGTEVIPMYKFRSRIRIPISCCEGYEFYFQIRNNADNEGWKITRFEIAYEILPEDPSYLYTNTN